MPKMFCLAVALCLLGRVHGQAVLEPPFGLKWGDSPEKLLDWASRHELDVRITIPGKRPALRVFRIRREEDPLPGARAHALEARFLRGRLFEVTVDYGASGESAEEVEARFAELKRQLTAEYGELSANKRERNIEDQFATTKASFHREPVQGLFLLLARTEVEDLRRDSRRLTFSLLYRNDNLRRRIEAAAP